MAAYVRGSNPIWFLVDLTANAFDDTFYMFVLQNTIPYLPADVYHTSSGTVWSQPIRFLANGTLPEDIFFDPGTTENPILYRLEFRHGNTQADPLIYLVENYAPGSGGGSGPITEFSLAMENQITNPQFSLTNFGTSLTVSATDPVLEIAPGWTLELSGTGNVTVTQVPLNNSADTINPTNAPYALRINQTGFTSPKLRQRFEQNGMLWANKTVAASITAKVTTPPVTITADLIDSNGTTLATVLPAKILSASFAEYTDHDTLGGTTNPDIPPAAYIDFVLNLPVNSDVYVTSIQLIVLDIATDVTYQQDSINRQIDHTFNYYKDPLIIKPIPSMLVGWDFAFNPAQIAGYAVAAQAFGAGTSYYAWDQTILFQTANSAITVSKDNTNSSLKLTAAATTQMAVIQYLSASQARNIFQTIAREGASVNILIASNPVVTMTLSLWWTANASLPTLSTNDSLVTGLGTNGLPAVVAGWHQITRNLIEEDVFTNTANDTFENFGFSDFDDDAAYTTAGKFFAIVLGTSSMASTNYINIKSISLVPGILPTIPAAQTPDEVLRECEYYYEKSYKFDVVPTTPAAITQVNSLTIEQAAQISGGNTVAVNSSFSIQYRNIKINDTPTVHLYDPVGGAIDEVRAVVQTDTTLGQLNVAVASFWIKTGSGAKGVSYLTQASSPIALVGVADALYSGYINFHYTADARLGIV